MKQRLPRVLGMTGLAAALVLGGSMVMPGSAAPAAATPGDTCSSDNIYGIVGYVQETDEGDIAVPSQIMEYTIGADGNISSSSAFSDIVNGESVGGSEFTGYPIMDGLGLAADCSFYFVQNTDFTSSTPQVDLYRYNPEDPGDAPVLMQQNYSMNSPTASNVNAGAVSPSGEYYFGYFSRQQPSDPSDATVEALRLHLYRYVYDATHDPTSTVQPNVRSGEVAHIDIEVPAEAFMVGGAPAPTSTLHGDLAFDQAGNLMAFVSSEFSNDQVSLVLPKAEFDGLDGNWKAAPSDPYIPVPLVNATPAAHTNHALATTQQYMGVAYRADGDLQHLSLAPNAAGNQYDLGFSQLNPVTLESLSDTFSQLTIPAVNVYGGATVMTYPMDLASNNYAGTLSATLSVDEVRDAETDVFSLVAADATGAELSTVTLLPGETTAALTPALTTPGSYTVTQSIAANAEFYSTAWSCSTSAGVELATGTGAVATVAVNSGEAVSCAFTNTLNRVIAGTPTITGDLTIGSTVTAEPGSGWGPAGVNLAYQWFRDGQPIDGATAAKYTLVAADLGANLTVQVTGTLEGHVTAEQASAPVVPVKPSDPVPNDDKGDGSSAGAKSDGSNLANTGADFSMPVIAGVVALLLGAGVITASTLRRRAAAK